jgi:hypothetical protein
MSKRGEFLARVLDIGGEQPASEEEPTPPEEEGLPPGIESLLEEATREVLRREAGEFLGGILYGEKPEVE